MNNRGDAGVTVILAVAVLALGFMLPKPKFLSGESRRADASQEATAEVAKAVEEAKKSEEAKGAKVAASLQQIGVANSETADSPQKEFISREIAHVTPLLPPPDYKALLAAEQRRLAVMQGKLELADQLYNKATKENERLLRLVEKTEQNFRHSLDQRREVDLQLSEAAAAVRAREQIIGVLVGVSILLGLLYVLAKMNGVSLQTLAVAAGDLRKGHDPIQTLDRILTLPQQAKIAKLVNPLL